MRTDQIIRRSVTWFIRSLLLFDRVPLHTERPVFDLHGKQITLVEPNTMKRLLSCKRKMRKAKILAQAGYKPPPKGESVQVLWNKHGWMPPREVMHFVAQVPVIEQSSHVAEFRAAKKAAR